MEPLGDLGHDAARVVAGMAFLFGLMFATGGALLLRPGVAMGNAALAVVGFVGLRMLAARGRS